MKHSTYYLILHVDEHNHFLYAHPPPQKKYLHIFPIESIINDYRSTGLEKPKGSPPTFKEKPKVNQQDKNLVVECSCNASPKPTLTWYKDSKVLMQGPRYKMRSAEKGDDYTFYLDILVSAEIFCNKLSLSYGWNLISGVGQDILKYLCDIQRFEISRLFIPGNGGTCMYLQNHLHIHGILIY